MKQIIGPPMNEDELDLVRDGQKDTALFVYGKRTGVVDVRADIPGYGEAFDGYMNSEMYKERVRRDLRRINWGEFLRPLEQGGAR